MTTDDSPKSIDFDRSEPGGERSAADISFLDGLNNDTLALVELIMTASMGRKDALQKLKLNVLP
jgi:hypothetical protein